MWCGVVAGGVLFTLYRIQWLEHKLLSVVGRYREVQRRAQEGSTVLPHPLPGRFGTKVCAGVALTILCRVSLLCACQDFIQGGTLGCP